MDVNHSVWSIHTLSPVSGMYVADIDEGINSLWCRIIFVSLVSLPIFGSLSVWGFKAAICLRDYVQRPFGDLRETGRSPAIWPLTLFISCLGSCQGDPHPVAPTKFHHPHTETTAANRRLERQTGNNAPFQTSACWYWRLLATRGTAKAGNIPLVTSKVEREVEEKKHLKKKVKCGDCEWFPAGYFEAAI